MAVVYFASKLIITTTELRYAALTLTLMNTEKCLLTYKKKV